MDNSLLVIIPAYNEADSLPGVLRSLKKTNLTADTVIINDCSTDSTREVAESFNVAVINLPINLGIGGAMQTGYRYALSKGYKFAVQVDGDGQHIPEEIKKLEETRVKTNADLVIGSRFVSDTGYRGTSERRLGILVFSILTKLLIGQSIKDATSGFRLANRKVIEFFAENYPTDYPEPEVLVHLEKMGVKIVETPVKMSARDGGRSSITTIKSIYYMFKVIFSMLISKLRKA